jgi:isoleucyl-tRNA synthetase
MKHRLNVIASKLNSKNYIVISTMKDSDLEGLSYKPLFKDFKEYKEKKGAL